MRDKFLALFVGFSIVSTAWARPPKPGGACHKVSFEGELRAGESSTRAIGNGLMVWFQPIASGWILRVIPQTGLSGQQTGPSGQYDYAELATPPYQSVTPLSISTDFAFRAQDAVGWNPRRFRFATSTDNFKQLEKAYLALEHSGATPPPPVQLELSTQIAQAASGTLTILDAKLTPGTEDQWRAAAAVASHFLTTAHTLVESPDGKSTPLGRLWWVRYRAELILPRGFAVDKALKALPQDCSNR